MGDPDRSGGSVDAVRRLVAERLGDDCELDVVDVLADPAAAERAKVLATPALMRTRPAPKVTVVGDLSDLERVGEALGLPDTEPAAGAGSTVD